MAKHLFRSPLRPATIRQSLLPVAASLFVVLLVLACILDTFPGDEWMLGELQQVRGPWLNDAAVVLSTLGQGGIGWGIAVPWVPLAVVAATLAARRWVDAAFLALATVAPIVNLGLKELVERSRPGNGLSLVMETGFAFPSGHAVFAASFLGAVIWLVGSSITLDGHPSVRRTAQALLLLFILAIGFSRLYLGVHWPSDVIGGFLFGGLYLSLLVEVRLLLERRIGPCATVEHSRTNEQSPAGPC